MKRTIVNPIFKDSVTFLQRVARKARASGEEQKLIDKYCV